jgi:phosphoglycolate phosphatase
MPPYPVALFDFDGTLADSFPWFCAVLNEVAAAHGFRQVAPDEVDTLRALDTRAILASLRVPAWKLPLIAVDFRRRSAANAAAIPLHAGVPEALRSIAAAGVRLAVVSSNAEATVRQILGPELVPLVGHFGCGASLFGKPAKFRASLKALGVGAAEAVAVGDEQRDVEAAREAGIAAAAVTWGFATGAALRAASPDRVFDTVAEMAAALSVGDLST